MYNYDALIIGAGFSGLYQLIRLRENCDFKVKILESAEDVGGTWFWNRYPGARCDSESYSYCYYFSDELLKEWKWSERFPQQKEVLKYLNFVTNKFDLRKDILFNTKVVKANYDSVKNNWILKTHDGKVLTSTYLITAVGCLSSANIPDIAGLEKFHGEKFHTGLWPHNGVDFRDKTVAVIGTGSTGIQIIPEIASQAKKLYVFQRTPNYSIPARNSKLSNDFQNYIKNKAKEIKSIMISNTNGHPFYISNLSVHDLSDLERTKVLESSWKKGGLEFRAVFKDLLNDEKANKYVSDFIKKKINEIVKDDITASNLTNIDHPFATKRPPVDSNYFETYNRNNVSLINLRNTPIKQITTNCIKTSVKEFKIDNIVFATGFDAMTGSLLKIDFEGKDNISLKEVWSSGPINYLGIQIPGFPNLFTITGPGSPSVLCNMPRAIEHHVDWITNCIKFLKKKNIKSIEAKNSYSIDWVKEVNKAADSTLMPKARHSWYLGANIPGKPRMFMPYAGGFSKYISICSEEEFKNYPGFNLIK